MDFKKETREETFAATVTDLEFIQNWLKQEYENSIEGFYSHLEIIQEGQRKGKLYVSRENGDAVAFQLGKYQADIVSVRVENRRGGHATRLLRALVLRAERAGQFCLTGKCAPESSFDVWGHLGFKRWYPQYRSGIWVYYQIEKTNDLSPFEMLVDVNIEFFRGAAIHETDPMPFQTQFVKGGVTTGQILLERRIFGIDEVAMDEMAVRITVANEELLFCKTTDLRANLHGVIAQNPHMVSVTKIELKEQRNFLREIACAER